jgi:hypothetical protein
MTHDPTEQAALKNYAQGMWGDYRRAAALITHHGLRDPDGINHVIDEAAEHCRISELFLAVCGLYEELVSAPRQPRHHHPPATPRRHVDYPRRRQTSRAAMLKPCLDCGQPTDGNRCDEHRVDNTTFKSSASVRGYDRTWRKLSERARRRQRFCEDCGTTEDLQADHSPQAWTRKAQGLPIRLQDISVVCGPCNRRRGAARTRRDNPNNSHRDPQVKAKFGSHIGEAV